MDEKHPVRVTILNQPYTLVAGDDAREVEELAHSVDELLHSIAAKASTADSTRVESAVEALAAMECSSSSTLCASSSTSRASSPATSVYGWFRMVTRTGCFSSMRKSQAHLTRAQLVD